MSDSVMIVREATVTYRVVLETSDKIDSPELVATAVRALWNSAPVEEFFVVYLNTRHRVLDLRRVATGTLNQALVHPREVFAAAIELRASAIILAHTHPSGDPNPSAEDLSVTDRLRRAGSIMGIPLVDHVIVTSHSFYSMRRGDPAWEDLSRIVEATRG